MRPAIQGPIDRAPQGHFFWDQRVDCIEVGDSLPRYTCDELQLAKFAAVKR